MNAVAAGHIQSPFHVDIRYPHDPHILHQAENAGVVLAHVAYPDHPNRDSLL